MPLSAKQGLLFWSNMVECCWADKTQRDASQAPLDVATEHLSKCGQTDESRLRELPPKGKVTFSGGTIWDHSDTEREREREGKKKEKTS